MKDEAAFADFSQTKRWSLQILSLASATNGHCSAFPLLLSLIVSRLSVPSQLTPKSTLPALCVVPRLLVRIIDAKSKFLAGYYDDLVAVVLVYVSFRASCVHAWKAR